MNRVKTTVQLNIIIVIVVMKMIRQMKEVTRVGHVLMEVAKGVYSTTNSFCEA